MILVDTSAWIDFFNQGSSSTHGRMINQWLDDQEDLCLTGIIVTEVLQGIASDSEFQKIQNFLLDFPIFSPVGIESFLGAANIYKTCRKKGFTLRSSIDCLISQIALENDLEVFHKDRDFEFISHFFQLKCVQVN